MAEQTGGRGSAAEEPADGSGARSAGARARAWVDGVLGAAAPGLEEVVDSRAFGTALAQTAGNLLALNRIGAEVMDLVWRNARVAGRADVVALHRQLARTEDKLERLLDTVERLEDELAAARRPGAAGTDRPVGD